MTRFIISHPPEMAAKVAAAWTEYRHDFFTPEFSGVALGVWSCSCCRCCSPWPVVPVPAGCAPAAGSLLPAAVGGFVAAALHRPPLHHLRPLVHALCRGRRLGAGPAGSGRDLGRLQRPPELRGGALQQVMGRGSPLVVAMTLLVLAIFTVAGVRANYPNFHPPSEGPHPLSMWGEQHCTMSRAA